MNVHEVMHQAVRVPGHLSVSETARVMDHHQMDSVLVEHGTVVGIFTERDILRKVVARDLDPASVKVSEMMSHPLLTIPSDAHVEDASVIMEQRHVRRLVVVERGAVIGIVSAACIAHNLKYITARRLMASHFEAGSEEFGG